MDDNLPVNPVVQVYDVRVLSEDSTNRVLYLERIQMMEKRIKTLEKRILDLLDVIRADPSKAEG